MKRNWYHIGIAIGVLFLLGGVSLYTIGEPYVDYEVSGFTDLTFVPVNTLTIGVETPPILGGLVFDFSLSCRLESDRTQLLFTPAGQFAASYGTSDTYILVGCSIDTSVGFSAFLRARLSFKAFGSAQGSSGGL